VSDDALKHSELHSKMPSAAIGKNGARIRFTNHFTGCTLDPHQAIHQETGVTAVRWRQSILAPY
jgi:hypothetical protein